MNINQVRAILKQHQIKYTEDRGFSGFTYTRVVFDDLKTVEQVEALIGVVVQSYFHRYALTFY